MRWSLRRRVSNPTTNPAADPATDSVTHQVTHRVADRVAERHANAVQRRAPAQQLRRTKLRGHDCRRLQQPTACRKLQAAVLFHNVFTDRHANNGRADHLADHISDPGPHQLAYYITHRQSDDLANHQSHCQSNDLADYQSHREPDHREPDRVTHVVL